MLEGEFFAGHSFSNINEQLAAHLCHVPDIALSLRRAAGIVRAVRYCHWLVNLRRIFERSLAHAADVTIRHAFPPNWYRPPEGQWVHIQPWEFGVLPSDWLPHLRDEVDEIWVMSRYVEAVYLNSGVAPQKLHYIPWGIDPLIFRPDAPPRQLPTSKSFRFLYVGGTILRKGFDRVLNAYLAEFGPHDDVCLVVKDVGTNSFYAPQCMRSQVIAAMRDPANPTIIYLEEEMTAGQLASLYTACHCLASPYRGEGFGLPVLEGLACGLPPIVPSGGPTDDFVDPESGYLLPSTVVPAEGVANLPGPGGELQISIEDLRTTMRRIYENGDATRRAGLAGSQRVRRDFTWQVTTQHIVNRLRTIQGQSAGQQSHNCNLRRGAAIEV